jgi:non-homologous end joining protein Ku
MKISKKDYLDMENALISVAEKKFDSNYYIDKVQREILDHLHWHARPERWEIGKFPLKS